MNKKAFSLIELIVGITISMILMVSVGVFVSNGMQNILVQQKVLENTDNFTDFSSNLNTTFNLIQSGSFIPVTTASGIIFKRGQNFGEGGFTYIGTDILDGAYCGTGSEYTKTNSIYIKNFIPFEENGEDIFSNYNEIITGKSGIYTSFQKEHVIKDNSGNIVVGKGIFGYKFIEGASGTDIYLNSPTGLASDGINLYISDTLNNRILFLDSSNKIHLLLDEYDGLNEPTGLYYEDNSLYIANSGNGEILKYSSKSTAVNPTLTMSGFSENINEISISFLGNNPPNLTSLGNFNITGNSTNPNYLTGTTNELKYYFVTKNAESVQTTCSGTEIKFSGGKPSLYCTKAGSGETVNYPTNTINEIAISNLAGLTNTGSYYVNLKLFNLTEKYSGYYPYFTQSDNDLTTQNNNTLTVLQSGLNYPTGIWGTSSYNQFLDGTYSDLDYHNTDILLLTPIKSLEITNTANDLISLSLKYYKRYNCYNLDDNAERTYLLKKNLK